MLLTVFFCCNPGRTSQSGYKINTRLNSEYRNSKKSMIGHLDKDEYSAMKQRLESELNTEIPEGKSILINFNQKAPNCLKERFGNIEMNIHSGVEMSHRISSENNTLDFFVFTDDSFKKSFYSSTPTYQLDSGFFYNTIFTLHENCEAFFILKPNDFMKQ